MNVNKSLLKIDMREAAQTTEPRDESWSRQRDEIISMMILKQESLIRLFLSGGILKILQTALKLYFSLYCTYSRHCTSRLLFMDIDRLLRTHS